MISSLKLLIYCGVSGCVNRASFECPLNNYDQIREWTMKLVTLHGWEITSGDLWEANAFCMSCSEKRITEDRKKASTPVPSGLDIRTASDAEILREQKKIVSRTIIQEYDRVKAMMNPDKSAINNAPIPSLRDS